ncbi:MAG: FHA domain-containing protein [Clostridia bacterium]|nr:FHA domain-containing protein [Clostridia bacterium]
MQEIVSKGITYIFVIVVYLFIYAIIRMIFLDIRAMAKKKTVIASDGAYLKLVNIRRALPFAVSESYELKDSVIIGRGKGCSIKIEDDTLSLKHCRVFEQDGSYYLEDLKSTNGTLLNGEKIEGDAIELLDGDKVAFGQMVFLFVNNAAAEGK